MELEGWWIVVTTVWPLWAKFFRVTISPRDVAESRPKIVVHEIKAGIKIC